MGESDPHIELEGAYKFLRRIENEKNNLERKLNFSKQEYRKIEQRISNLQKVIEKNKRRR